MFCCPGVWCVSTRCAATDGMLRPIASRFSANRRAVVGPPRFTMTCAWAMSWRSAALATTSASRLPPTTCSSPVGSASRRCCRCCVRPTSWRSNGGSSTSGVDESGSRTSPSLGRFEDRVTVHCADEGGRADLAGWRPVDPRTRVYACGPERLIDAVERWGAVPGGHPARVERFAASASVPTGPMRSFEVHAARSQETAIVLPGESIVAALRRVGVDVLTSCAQGVCGTCETEMLEGHPDHRDSLLDDAERAAAPACSRVSRAAATHRARHLSPPSATDPRSRRRRP